MTNFFKKKLKQKFRVGRQSNFLDYLTRTQNMLKKTSKISSDGKKSRVFGLDKYFLPVFLKQKFGSVWKKKISIFARFFFFLSLKPLVSVQAYKLFTLMELQVNAVLQRSQLVPFFFLINDLCFYRIIFINQKIISSPHTILAVHDSMQLPLFLYQIINYRQNRFYYYPLFLKTFFKLYWGQFTDYNKDKIWLLSNYMRSEVSGEVFIYNYPCLLLYMSPFRRFTKLYYKMQPERPRFEDAGLTYSYTVFKLHLFNYANFYK